jgi:undecaprenyl-diphosphatase
LTSTQRAQVAGACAALVAFAIVVQQVMTDGWLVDVDRRLAEGYSHHQAGRVHSLHRLLGSGRLVTIAKAFTPFGDAGLLLTIIGVVAIVLYTRRQRREAAFLITAAVGGVILDLVTRSIVGQVRPDLPIANFIISRDGLPSGHALDATVCYGALLLVAWSLLSHWQRIIATLATGALVGAVSYSRVVVLAHYLSDVLAGDALGLAWLLALAAAFSLPRRDRLPPAA